MQTYTNDDSKRFHSQLQDLEIISSHQSGLKSNIICWGRDFGIGNFVISVLYSSFGIYATFQSASFSLLMNEFSTHFKTQYSTETVRGQIFLPCPALMSCPVRSCTDQNLLCLPFSTGVAPTLSHPSSNSVKVFCVCSAGQSGRTT